MVKQSAFLFMYDIHKFIVFCQGTNDDLILECCLHFCNDKARDFMPKDRGGLDFNRITFRTENILFKMSRHKLLVNKFPPFLSRRPK